MRRAWSGAVVLYLAAAACTPSLPESPPETPDAGPPPPGDGYDAPPGSGVFFLMDDLALARDEDLLDVDGDGTPDGEVNSALESVRVPIDTKFRSEITSGGYLIGLEVAGLDSPYEGHDDAVTLKVYSCDDVDDDPTNNYCASEGCGEVRPKPDTLVDGQTPYRSDPAPIVDGLIDATVDESYVLDQDGFALRLQRMRFVAYLPRTLAELRDGRFCGVASARDLDHTEVPVCRWLPVLCDINPGVPDTISLAAYLVILGKQPEIDMDGDGLERIRVDDTGDIAACTDGDGRVVEGSTCLDDPSMNDGYALCFTFHAVPATLVVDAAP